MKKLLPVFLFLSFFANESTGQSNTLAVKFADAIIKRHQPNINNMTGKGWEYSNGIILHGIEKVYDNLPDSTVYLNYIKAYVDAYVNGSGAISGMAQNLDKIHPGLLCLFLYEKTGQTKYLTAATYLRNYLIGTPATPSTYPKTPNGGYWHKNTVQYNRVMMVDGMYMAHPFLAKYGSMFNDNIAIDTAVNQLLFLHNIVYDETTHLARHAWHYDKSKTWANPITGLSHDLWSRGMGWYMMAIVDILTYLPESHPRFNELKTALQNLSIGVKNSQDPATGMWYQVMDRGDDANNWHESSGSGMFIYALKTAATKGWIDSSYLNVARKGWQGLKTKISLNADGGPQINQFAPAMSVLDTYVAYINTTPVNCPPPSGTKHPHGYCAVLMAATAMEFPFYKISANAINGSVIATPAGNSFSNGTIISITAVPDSGYEFLGWTGDITGTTADTIILLNGNKTVTANFSAVVNEYIFNGDGNWSDASNWMHNKIPPEVLLAGKSILIDHADGGECILDITQHIAVNANFTVKEGKKLLIPGDLIIQ